MELPLERFAVPWVGLKFKQVAPPGSVSEVDRSIISAAINRLAVTVRKADSAAIPHNGVIARALLIAADCWGSFPEYIATDSANGRTVFVLVLIHRMFTGVLLCRF